MGKPASAEWYPDPTSRPDCAGLPDTDGELVFDWTTAAVGMFQREQNGCVMAAIDALADRGADTEAYEPALMAGLCNLDRQD